MRLAIWAGIALTLVPCHANAQTTEQLYEQGVAARQAGNPERALVLLERLVAAEPRNADAQLQLGLALLALDRLADAQAAFERTLAIAPDYADARIGLARVRQRRGDSSGALALLQPVDPADAEAGALRRQLVSSDRTSPGSWRLDLDGSYSDLEQGRTNWKEAAARIGYHVTSASSLSATLEYASRFGLEDLFAELRADHRLSEGASGYIALGGTVNADFRPRWQVSAGGALRVRGGPAATVLTLDARQADYKEGDIQTLIPGVEQYLAGGRAWLTARWINIFDQGGDHRGGWLGRGDAMVSDRLRLFAGASDAPDTSEGIVVDVFSTFGGAAYQLSKGTELRFSLAHENREAGADRLQIGLGLGLRF